MEWQNGITREWVADWSDPSEDIYRIGDGIANPNVPLEVAMTRMKLLESKRKDIFELAARHGATRIRVFGSVARGEEGSTSDVDLLVDLEPGRSLFDLGGLLMDLQNLLGCKVDVITEKGLRPRIREKVLREAVPL